MSTKIAPVLSFLPEYPLAMQHGLPGYAEIYPYRALVVGEPTGLALVNATTLPPDLISIDFLHSLGLGPSRENVLFLEGVSNIPARRMLEPQNASLLESLKGCKLECYSLRGGDAELAIALGADSEFVRLQSAISHQYDDKVHFRDLLTRLGLSNLLIDGGVVYNQQQAVVLARCLFRTSNKVVVLTNPRLAGGVGFSLIKNVNALSRLSIDATGSLLTAFMDSWFSPSINWILTQDGPRLQGVTIQLLNGFDHAGNIIPSGMHEYQICQLVSDTLPVALELWREGYIGEFGIDAILPKKLNKTPRGFNFKYVELNARRVAPYFQRRVMHTLGIASVCIMKNVFPISRFTSEQIHEKLKQAGLLYGFGGNVIPYMTAGGLLPKPKFAVFCIGDNVNDAYNTAMAVKALFTDTTRLRLPRLR